MQSTTVVVSGKGSNPKTTLYVGGLQESVNEAILHSAFIPFGAHRAGWHHAQDRTCVATAATLGLEGSMPTVSTVLDTMSCQRLLYNGSTCIFNLRALALHVRHIMVVRKQNCYVQCCAPGKVLSVAGLAAGAGLSALYD